MKEDLRRFSRGSKQVTVALHNNFVFIMKIVNTFQIMNREFLCRSSLQLFDLTVKHLHIFIHTQSVVTGQLNNDPHLNANQMVVSFSLHEMLIMG